MNKGIVLFAHNNRQVDYALMSIIAGGLAKKHLSVPVSLITDDSTVEWLKECDKYSVAESVFDKIIITERPVTANTRNLNDGNLKNVVASLVKNRGNVGDTEKAFKQLHLDADLATKQDFSPFPVAVKPSFNADKNLESFDESHEVVEESLSLSEREKEFIMKALEKHRGRRKNAAQELGISERTLYRKIKEYDIQQ